MHYSPPLLVHICGGTIGLLSGFAAMAFRKGSRYHGPGGALAKTETAPRIPPLRRFVFPNP